MPLLVSTVALCMIVPGWWRQLSGPEEPRYLSLWVSVLFAVGFGMLVYRNLWVRDSLWLAWSMEADVAADTDALVLDAATVRAVRVLPAAGAYSEEGKWVSLGLAAGRIEIETADDVVRFGAGLSTHRLGETAERIEAYCGLRRINRE